MVRALAALVVIVMALAGCSRSRGLSDQVSLGGTGGTGGTQNTGAFAGNGQAGITGGGNPTTGVAASGAGAGAGGQGSRPIGVAGTAGVAAPPPPTVTPPPPPPPDNGRAGRDGRGSGGRGGGDANIAGTGGRSDSGPSVGGMILNPNGCHSERPFVLSIAPSGDRGTVSGWLESTPQLAFENELPRFDPTPGGDLAVWWSIGSVDQGMGASLYFYGENDATRVAVAVGARDFDEIDSSRLTFDDWVTPAVMPGTIVVFENTETGERVAMRADKVLDTDPNVSLSGTCAALEASYSFDF
jgi:hypothetical protein